MVAANMWPLRKQSKSMSYSNLFFMDKRSGHRDILVTVRTSIFVSVVVDKGE